MATSQLAGNAISLIMPGGAAVGAATQFRMLAAAGNDPATAVGGLTAFSLLGIAGLLALPIFVLPAILAGTPIASGLRSPRCSASLASSSSPASAPRCSRSTAPCAGPAASCRRREPLEAQGRADDRPARPTGARARRIRHVLGRRWKAATLLSSGRLFFDFWCLLAAIRATGAKPNPSLVLLAYAVAGLLR